MANIPEPAAGFVAVYQLETTDKALAGASGVMNTQAAQLMARDSYINERVNNTVDLVSAQAVAGYKTWNAAATWNLSSTGSIVYGQPGGDSTGITMLFGATGSARRTDIRARASDVLIGCSAVSDGSAPTRFLSVADFAIRPTVTNVMSCGTAIALWTTVYATNSTISTSDARLKTEPRQLWEAERKAASALARLPCIWTWLTGDRLHAGPTVQAAIAVMEAHGLDPFAYSFICYDEWEAEEATYDDKGNELKAAREAGNRYSFRKEELLCFMVPALAAEHDALDARLTALENR